MVAVGPLTLRLVVLGVRMTPKLELAVLVVVLLAMSAVWAVRRKPCEVQLLALVLVTRRLGKSHQTIINS